tara:strand:+ start:53 stop:580 length:528 start_codon:yes stop_codon:yes gene_type:complete
MIKKSKVTNVQGGGTWSPNNNPDKIFYGFEVEMENGDIGQYSSIKKEQDKFIVGQEVEYEFIDGRFPKVKPVYQKPGFSGGSKGGYTDADKMRMAKSVAIKSASIFYQQRDVKKEVIKAFADFCYDYIVEGNDEPKQANTSNTAKAMHDFAKDPFGNTDTDFISDNKGLSNDIPF